LPALAFQKPASSWRKLYYLPICQKFQILRAESSGSRAINPSQRSTGKRGYLAKRLSFRASWHIRNRLPLADVISFLWRQAAHSPDSVGGLTTGAWLLRVKGIFDYQVGGHIGDHNDDGQRAKPAQRRNN
jgi:hypothetical protein